MDNPGADAAFHERVEKLESLLQEIENCADPVVRAQSVEVVQTLMEYHSTGLSRILQHIAQAGPAGERIISEIANDDLVSSLLLLYGLHPDDVDSRVRRAVETVTPAVQKMGGIVELISLQDGVVRIHAERGSHSCQSTAGKIKTAIEDAIIDKAPEVAGIEIDGLSPPAVSSGFVPVEQLLGRRKSKTGDTHALQSTAETNAY